MVAVASCAADIADGVAARQRAQGGEREPHDLADHLPCIALRGGKSQYLPVIGKMRPQEWLRQDRPKLVRWANLAIILQKGLRWRQLLRLTGNHASSKTI
jgi:hypothetical protein